MCQNLALKPSCSTVYSHRHLCRFYVTDGGQSTCSRDRWATSSDMAGGHHNNRIMIVASSTTTQHTGDTHPAPTDGLRRLQPPYQPRDNCRRATNRPTPPPPAQVDINLRCPCQPGVHMHSVSPHLPKMLLPIWITWLSTRLHDSVNGRIRKGNVTFNRSIPKLTEQVHKLLADKGRNNVHCSCTRPKYRIEHNSVQ